MLCSFFLCAAVVLDAVVCCCMRCSAAHCCVSVCNALAVLAVAGCRFSESKRAQALAEAAIPVGSLSSIVYTSPASDMIENAMKM